MPEHEALTGTQPLHHREITLADGRYMIFYTFGDTGSTGGVDRKAERIVETTEVRTPDAEGNDV